jgi:hypothetical protein
MTTKITNGKVGSRKLWLAGSLAAAALAAPALPAHAAGALLDSGLGITPIQVAPPAVMFDVHDASPLFFQLPDPACPNRIDYHKVWTRDTDEQQAGSRTWKVGTGTKLGFVADCTQTKLSFEASMNAALFSTDSDFNAKVLSATLAATSTKLHHNTADLTLKSFGFEIGSYPITEGSDSPITHTYPLNLMLPASNFLHNQWDDSYTFHGVTVGYTVKYDVIGSVSGSLAYTIGPAGINVNAMAAGVAKVHATAAGSVQALGHKLVATGDATITGYDGEISAVAGVVSAYLEPQVYMPSIVGGVHGPVRAPAQPVISTYSTLVGGFPHCGAACGMIENAWKLTAELKQNLKDALHGKFDIKFDLDDGEATYNKNIFNLGGVPADKLGVKTWGTTLTWYKP